MGGLEVGTDPPPIGAEWIEEPRRDVEEGNVVISRHDDLRERQPIEKRGCLPELVSPRALGQIAGDSDHVGPNRRDALDEAEE